MSEGRYRDESISETPKLERTGAATDPVRAACPEDHRGKKLIGFGSLEANVEVAEV